jgi:hypothetical protein
MVEKLNYSGLSCASGILISFSGLNLSLDETYKIKFDNVNTIPLTTVLKLNPTGYMLTPSEPSPVLQTFFSSVSNISDNSSINLVSLSVYNSNEELIYRDYKSIACENMCGSGVPISPTPSVTPTITPTNTPTPTPTPPPPTPPALLNIRAMFDRLINQLGSCDKVLIRAKAYGNINQTYTYSFGTDMSGVNLGISNPSGFITILENPTYVYTTISLPESCKNYSLEFGLSDGTNTVQSAAIFRCGNC